MTTRLGARCSACLEPLVLAPRGHGKRFCGVACRMAAYRRRQQGISEKSPRWGHPRGRLRLARARAFDRRMAALQKAREERAEQRERYRRLDEERAAEWARRKAAGRRWSLGEMALLEEDLTARRQPQPPLADDWVYRSRT